VNRVILCTDGDFNVGASSDGELVRLIEVKRETGVFLSVFGFGTGNVQMAKMEKLAQHGNGVFGYIDSLNEAKKTFVDDLAGTLVTIAKDVKVQVEFNPARVGAYRLIGYENRLMAAQDFRNDAKDAGEIGAGHTVTFLYELMPADEIVELAAAAPSRYRKADADADVPEDVSHELLTVFVRYKAPDGIDATELAFPTVDHEAGLNNASAELRFAAAVAGFGMILRDSPYKGEVTFETVLDLAGSALDGDDERGLRAEFMSLTERAREISEN
jgi:Ca-activated chloride channel family protein